jgi:NADPH:quinone reductase-like Zn-dependent oxidoreductase
LWGRGCAGGKGILALVEEQKIDPLVSRTFPLLEARKALELLATGSVEGKIVLTI